jgi:hypothetical protein
MGEGVHELERLTARQLQQLIEGGISTAVVPFGSVEHHGGYLPLAADAIRVPVDFLVRPTPVVLSHRTSIMAEGS